MKEQLLRQLIDIIRETKDFTLEQAPDVAKQIVLMGRIGPILNILLFGLGCYLYSKLYKFIDHKTKDDGDNALHAITLIIFILMVMWGCHTFTHSLDILITAWFAPKLYLLESLARIVKPN